MPSRSGWMGIELRTPTNSPAFERQHTSGGIARIVARTAADHNNKTSGLPPRLLLYRPQEHKTNKTRSPTPCARTVERTMEGTRKQGSTAGCRDTPRAAETSRNQDSKPAEKLGERTVEGELQFLQPMPPARSSSVPSHTQEIKSTLPRARKHHTTHGCIKASSRSFPPRSCKGANTAVL